jgi:site-specific DNA-methyltransferase (adenine-specific)
MQGVYDRFYDRFPTRSAAAGPRIDAAQRLGRKWIGIDVTFIAVDLIMNRLRARFPGIDLHIKNADVTSCRCTASIT